MHILKVLHVIPSLSPSQGGPSFALPLMARGLVKAGVDVDVATTDDDGRGVRLDVPLGQRLSRDGVNHYYFRKQTEFYKISLPFGRWLTEHVHDYHLLHIHALFSYTSSTAARAARRAGVAYIIRPLGVLNRWGMANRRRWLKAISFRFIEQPILRHAATIHYTSLPEQREAEAAGVCAPAAVIPLGIDVADFQQLPSPTLFFERFPQAAGRPLVLFLSRVDKKKGLDLLLPAFAQVTAKHPKTCLVVAGSGEADYLEELRSDASRLGIADSVIWAGFLAGKEKLSALAAATMFVLPSYSENFGIALVEALLAGLPCVLTQGVGIANDVREFEAGMVVAAELAPLAAALDELLGNEDLRCRYSANARQLVGVRFSLEAMSGRLLGLYSKVITRNAGLASTSKM